ncbi:MAG: hypothetical protein ACP5I8_11515 [Phycisphaerae bacterium]
MTPKTQPKFLALLAEAHEARRRADYAAYFGYLRRAAVNDPTLSPADQVAFSRACSSLVIEDSQQVSDLADAEKYCNAKREIDLEPYTRRILAGSDADIVDLTKRHQAGPMLAAALKNQADATARLAALPGLQKWIAEYTQRCENAARAG